MREVAQDWDDNFPVLAQSLDEIVRDNLRDILHFHVTLDVQGARPLP